VNPYAILAALAIVAGAYAGGRWQQHRLDILNQQAALVKAKDDALTEERRVTQANTEISNESQRLANRNRSDAARGSTADDRLRDAQSAYLAASTTAAQYRAAAGTLGELFSQCRAQLRGVAEEADAARTAGIECSQRYDTLTKPAH
jgi:hypothetical protein